MADERCRLLILGTSKDSHVDSVIGHLPNAVSYCRFDIDQYPTKASLDISISNGGRPRIRAVTASGTRFDLSEVRAVWFRRIGAPQLDQRIADKGHRAFALGEVESAIIGMAHLLADAEWVSPYEATKRASSKPYQLRLAAESGLIIPATLITNNVRSVDEFRLAHSPVLYKTMHSPSITYDDRRTLIFSHILTDTDREDLHQVSLCPCCFQHYVEKAYELRITYAGRRFHTVKINSQVTKEGKVDWRADIDNVEYERSDLPHDIESKLANFMRRLDLQYGAIDMIVSPDNEYVFLEVNPHGAWGWLENRLRIPISQSLAQHLSDLALRN